MKIQKNDNIFPLTRIIALIVTPFLLLAFYILYLHPETSGERFAWEIKPDIMAAFMGAGYMAGAYFFINIIIGRTWHRVAAIFPAITAFTISMLLATIIHWERFDIRHLPFQAWLILYILSPFLISGLWFYNRQTDPRDLQVGDILVPNMLRIVIRVIGAALALTSIAGFVIPNLLIQTWPWELTPLTARVVSGWVSLVGFGSLYAATQQRWSSWRIVFETIGIWEILILLGGFIYIQDLKTGWFNWLFVIILLQLISLVILYFNIETRRSNNLQRTK
ncbi:MAG: hypothetical protein H7Y59_03115 [Anaerolineales bacterium]|nr:hypothetical protein [Anaerolineales bacterium]